MILELLEALVALAVVGPVGLIAQALLARQILAAVAAAVGLRRLIRRVEQAGLGL
jgi:hypothetical protein